jgi:hypothetical protein
LIDVADYFIDLGEIAEKVRKEVTHGPRYDERDLHEHLPTQYMQEEIQLQQEDSADGFQSTMRVVLESTIDDEVEQFESAAEFIRITDDH